MVLAYVLTLVGGLVELTAFALGAWRARGGLKRLRRRVEDFYALREQETEETTSHDAGKRELDPDQNTNAELLDARAAARRKALLGREAVSWNDVMLIPELAGIEILKDQAGALKGPLLLAIVGVVLSMTGGLMSIF